MSYIHIDKDDIIILLALAALTYAWIAAEDTQHTRREVQRLRHDLHEADLLATDDVDEDEPADGSGE